jgi:hypothetical protein
LNFPNINNDLNHAFNLDFELGLCKMLKNRQKLNELVKGEKSSKKGQERRRREVDCSGGPNGVKMELNEWKDWIREADVLMFLYFFYTPENWQFHIMLRSKIKSNFIKLIFKNFRNFLDQANELEIDELRKRFVKLFGLARMVQLALHYPYPKIFGKISLEK